ncbi:MAG: hypothetical protein ABR523_09955, partial [Desulfurivibrionaceae bacterium]
IMAMPTSRQQYLINYIPAANMDQENLMRSQKTRQRLIKITSTSSSRTLKQQVDQLTLSLYVAPLILSLSKEGSFDFCELFKLESVISRDRKNYENKQSYCKSVRF